MNMKRILIVGVMILGLASHIKAQDIRVTQFERNYTSLIASMDAVYDNSGEACAVIRFFVRDEAFEIEPNLGFLKKETRTGEIRLWVPTATKRITVRYQGAIPLNSYEIPATLEPKATYDAVLEIRAPQKEKKASNNHFFFGAGYNVMSISGPSVTLGGNLNHHIIQADAVYGLGKSDEWYFYGSNGEVFAANSYQAFRTTLRYGYEIMASDYFGFIPMIGGAFNIFSGKAVDGVSKNNTYNSANSISLVGALGIELAFNEHIRLQVTPEYDFGISKSNLCKKVGENDSKFKSWTDGFNLNLTLLVYL